LWSLIFRWNILYQLLLSSQASGEWSKYIPQNCHPTTVYAQNCSVSKVHTAINFLTAFYFMVGGADCDRGNMQQMVQQAVDHAI